MDSPAISALASLKSVGTPEGAYVLELYVAGINNRSLEALHTIQRLCEEHLSGRYHLRVVDIYQDAPEAVRQNIIAAPTLVKSLPMPFVRLVGNLSNRERLLVGLGLAQALSQTNEPAEPAH